MTLDVYSACLATLGIVLQAVVVGILWPYLKRQRAVGIKAKKDSEAHNLLNHLREKAKNRRRWTKIPSATFLASANDRGPITPNRRVEVGGIRTPSAPQPSPPSRPPREPSRPETASGPRRQS